MKNIFSFFSLTLLFVSFAKASVPVCNKQSINFKTGCQDAFSGCEKLEHVIFLPDSQLITIEGNAFGNCTNLKTFYLPSSVTKILNYPFLFSPNVQIVTSLTSRPLSGWSNYWNASYMDYDQMTSDIKNGVVKDESDYCFFAPVYWNEKW